jgi:hypothetical protein
MKLHLVSAAAALLLVGGLGTSAKADGPWCAFYGPSTYNCGFHTYKQCYATIQGVGGTCRPNPWWRSSRNRDWR